MSHDEFTKLYVYMQEQFNRIDARFVTQDVKIDTLMGTVDGLAKRIDDMGQEVAMINHGLSRHERWIEQLAISTKTVLQ